MENMRMFQIVKRKSFAFLLALHSQVFFNDCPLNILFSEKYLKLFSISKRYNFGKRLFN
jgi:hypothetical protein